MLTIALPHPRVTVTWVRSIRWPIRKLGPYSHIAGFALLTLLCLTLSRVSLIAWQWHRVAATDSILWMLLQGIRNDLMIVGFCVAPLVLLLPLFLAIGRLRLGTKLGCVWLAICLVTIVFLEFATPQFIGEYDGRPNRLFLEYLIYPREVGAMLWNGYRTLTLTALVGIAAFATVVARHFAQYSRVMNEWRPRTVMLVWPLIVVVVFVAIRSSAQHRPANLASFAFSDDAMVNSLVVNSAYSVLSAAYSLKGESSSSEVYGEMPYAEMVAEVRAGMGVAPSDFISNELPTLHRQIASVRRERPLNLVIVLEESLGAGFVGKLGGNPITPNLDRLSDKGIWFDQLYATGTRSVRGIEAVVAGFPPTPALSVVKLSKAQQNFATLASVLRNAGYRNEFVYGGESHFDNMRGFFLGNGFHSVVDRKNFTAPKFVGSWGVSDEDLFDKAHERINSLGSAEEPFFMLVFSSSNHSPFEFPDGRIEWVDHEKQTVNNAIKYADFAMGQFIDRARASDYWKDTLFLVVADHDTRVYGDALVPISKFHIPGVILGADIEPRTIRSLASQIDLAPTLLSLLGIDSQHPFMGRDLTRTLPEFGNASALTPRAMMQFDQNFAWLENGRATVLLPDGAAHRFSYDSKTGQLDRMSGVDPAVAKRALANVLMPAWLYGEQRYKTSIGRE